MWAGRRVFRLIALRLLTVASDSSASTFRGNQLPIVASESPDSRVPHSTEGSTSSGAYLRKDDRKMKNITTCLQFSSTIMLEQFIRDFLLYKIWIIIKL